MDKNALDHAMDDMTFEPEERDAIARLRDADLLQIDQAILSALDRDWKKAGFITAGVMIAAPDHLEEIPEMFYALRLRALAQASRIEVKGDPLVLRDCEIRLASAH